MAIFTNQATLSYSGGTVNSNITTGEILEVLSATKTAVEPTYSEGQDTTYIVNVTNSGNTAFTGLILTDDLGAYTFGATTVVPLSYLEGSVKYFINGVLQPAPTVAAGPPLVISNITIPANSVATIAYTATANEFASPETTGVITNTVTVSGGITPVTASETVPAENAANLSITKSLTPLVVTENGQLTYTFVIQNTGNLDADATDNVVITDLFDPILSNITVTYNGAPWSEPANYTYNEVTGLFATAPGQITVPAATFTQDAVTGAWTITPGTAIITVTGTV